MAGWVAPEHSARVELCRLRFRCNHSKGACEPQHFFGLHYSGFRNRTALDELDSHRRRIFRASVVRSSHFSGKAVINTMDDQSQTSTRRYTQP